MIYEIESFQLFREKKWSDRNPRSFPEKPLHNYQDLLIFHVFPLPRSGFWKFLPKTMIDCFKGGQHIQDVFSTATPLSRSTMENTFVILVHAVSSRKLAFLTQTLSTLDIQRVLVLQSDSACRETPKSVEFAWINNGGVLKQSISFPVELYAYLPHTTLTSAAQTNLTPLAAHAALRWGFFSRPEGTTNSFNFSATVLT